MDTGRNIDAEVIESYKQLMGVGYTIEAYGVGFIKINVHDVSGLLVGYAVAESLFDEADLNKLINDIIIHRLK